MNKNQIINAIRTGDVPTILKDVSIYLRERGIKKRMKLDYYLTLARIEGDADIYLSRPVKNILHKKMHDYMQKVTERKNINNYRPERNSILKMIEKTNEEMRTLHSDKWRYAKIPCKIVRHGEGVWHLYFCSISYGMKDYNKFSFVLDTPSKIIAAKTIVNKCQHLFVGGDNA